MNKLKHIALILDGNGRYAENLAKSRSYGHKIGIKNVINIIEEASKLKIKYITLFCFSSQNWSREVTEINNFLEYIIIEIMNIIETDKYNNYLIKFIGDFTFSTIPSIYKEKINSLQKIVNDVNKNNINAVIRNKTVVTFAFNYGGKEEIINAVNKCITEQKTDITMHYFENKMWSSFLPDVDLLVRTSGEYRISNFMIWKLAYTELFFTKTLWPEFTKQEFNKIITDFKNKRNRRYGGYN